MTLTTEESDLIEGLLTKDEVAFKTFYDSYAPLLVRFVRTKVSEESDVEEITQDTLFAFLDGIRDFNGDCKISTYLCSIAHHKVIDFYRKKKIKKIVFSQLPDGFEELFASSSSPEDTMQHGFVKEHIASIFARLAPHYATMLRLKYIEGRSVDEIALMLSLSFKSAESILFRARKAFVKLYAEK